MKKEECVQRREGGGCVSSCGAWAEAKGRDIYTNQKKNKIK